MELVLEQSGICRAEGGIRLGGPNGLSVRVRVRVRVRMTIDMSSQLRQQTHKDCENKQEGLGLDQVNLGR